MREFTRLKTTGSSSRNGTSQLVLSYEQRQKSRLCAKLNCGEEIGVLLPHGQRMDARRGPGRK